MIRALPGLDVLCNPDFGYIWAKIDTGHGGYRGISDSEDRPEFPPEVLAAIMRMKESLAAARRPISGRPAATLGLPRSGRGSRQARERANRATADPVSVGREAFAFLLGCAGQRRTPDA